VSALSGHSRMSTPSEPDGSAEAVQIRAWLPADFARRVDEAMEIYVRAMGYRATVGRQRAVTARRHAANAGFACRAALLADGTLVGFGYGYTSRPGQWWHDLVRKALDPAAAQTWLTDAFELSELHVEPDWQGHRIGRDVLVQLAASLPHPVMLLSTPDADTRAFRMYRRLGFTDLRRDYHFPGDDRPFAVLGARLPFAGDDAR
jgi:ribosomal protein S18 acetylase RimI-like enzyme